MNSANRATTGRATGVEIHKKERGIVMSYALVTLAIEIAADTKDEALAQKDTLVKAINRLEYAGKLDDISTTLISITHKKERGE